MDADSAHAEWDIVIIGAGLAGLTAAHELRRSGRRVLVLEARSEVGGRTRSQPVDDAIADFGGQWIGWAHRSMRRLVRELRLGVEPARNFGSPILWRLPGGETCGKLPPARLWRDLIRFYVRALADGRGIDPAAPWRARRAAELDAVSVREWLDALNLRDDSRYTLERLIGALACESLESVSLLHILWLLRMAGGPVRSLHTTFQWRITGGAQEVSRRLAAPLGDAVHLNTPVQRVVQDRDGLAVHTAGSIYRGKRAIVAVPATQVANIEFDPPLPPPQQELSTLSIGAGTKIIATLPTGHAVRHNTVVGGDVLWAAWRQGDCVTGFVPAIADVSDDKLCTDLGSAFQTRAEDLRSTTVFRWAEQQHILGCDAAFAPGQVRRFGPMMARPHGFVRFAGAERSGWPDNMEGAARSGERTAGETLAGM